MLSLSFLLEVFFFSFVREFAHEFRNFHAMDSSVLLSTRQ
jgi:hypothetical protein